MVSDRYSVAWFKIADCIARGEKERALGVYRLLSHSFEDSAMACQLHGDILLSFQDKKQAIEKYKEAATLYSDSGRILEAAAVYEHLVTLEPDIVAHRIVLIDLYQQLHIPSKVCCYVKDLVQQLLSVQEWSRAIDVIAQYEPLGDNEMIAHLYALLTRSILGNPAFLIDTKVQYAQKAIDAWLRTTNEKAMQEFLADIKAREPKLYQHVSSYRTT